MSTHKWAWYVFGAHAVLVFGRPRMTADIDVTVDLGDEPASTLIEVLLAAGFHIRVDDPHGFVERTRVLPCYFEAADMPIDVVLAGPGLEQLFLSRTSSMTLDFGTVPVICKEDLVVTKLLSGRRKDLDDVLGILKRNENDINEEIIRELLIDLEKALGRSDLITLFEKLLAER